METSTVLFLFFLDLVVGSFKACGDCDSKI